MTDLFKQGESAPENSDQDFFSELVGPGKKYADEKALAKAYAHALPYIQRLEQENATNRAEMQTRLTVEEQIQKLQASSQRVAPESNPPEQMPSVSKEDILSEVKQLLNQQKQQTVAERNVEKVSQALSKAWGPSFQSKLIARAKELNVDQDFLSKLAESNPDAFISIVVPNQPSNNPAPPVSRVNSNALPSSSGERNNAYYQDLYKKNPKLRFDKATQIQEYKDAMRLGDSFF